MDVLKNELIRELLIINYGEFIIYSPAITLII